MKITQNLFNEVVKYLDCSVLVNLSGENEQNTAYKSGQMYLPLRCEGDWDNNTSLADNKFDDLVHFEIRNNLMIE